MQDCPPIRVTPIHPVDTDRDIRLEKAVALVTKSKYSVRKAAQALALPKSTVHRYLQATRGAGPVGVSKRPRAPRRSSPRPAKCDISFLVESDAASSASQPLWSYAAQQSPVSELSLDTSSLSPVPSLESSPVLPVRPWTGDIVGSTYHSMYPGVEDSRRVQSLGKVWA